MSCKSKHDKEKKKLLPLDQATIVRIDVTYCCEVLRGIRSYQKNDGVLERTCWFFFTRFTTGSVKGEVCLVELGGVSLPGLLNPLLDG